MEKEKEKRKYEMWKEKGKGKEKEEKENQTPMALGHRSLGLTCCAEEEPERSSDNTEQAEIVKQFI